MSIREYSIETKYRILGFDDDQCSCDICGKQELRGTYKMEDIDSGTIFRAGGTCGARMAGWTVKQLLATYKLGEKENIEAARNELRNSPEYIAYENGLNFLNKEHDVIERKLHNCRDQNTRNEIEATKRTLKNRLEYLRPLSTALENKRVEIVAKYNLRKGYYLS